MGKAKPRGLLLLVTLGVVAAGATFAIYNMRDPAAGVAPAQTGAASAPAHNAAPAEGTSIPLNAENTAVLFTGSSALGPQPAFPRRLNGTLHLGPDGEVAALRAELDMTSITSQSDELTRKLKHEPGFFDVERFPVARFESSGIDALDPAPEDATHRVVGTFTLKDVTRELRFPIHVGRDAGAITITATFTLDRHEWHIDYDGGTLYPDIRDNVLVELEITAAPGAAGAAAP
jgi:polyisoprenoid-binding protein YceI